MAVGDVLLGVNGRPAPNVAGLAQALGQARRVKPKRVMFYVKRGIHTLYLEVEPNWDIVKD